MTTQYLKIAISGPVGSGKTTLAKELGKKFNLPILEENCQDLLLARKTFRNLRDNKEKDKLVLQSAFRNWIKSYFSWAEQRARHYAELDGFIADRWEADILTFWLWEFMRFNVNKETAQLLQHLKTQADIFTLAVVLPPCKYHDVEKINEHGLLRIENPNAHIIGNAIMLGLIKQYTTMPCLSISTNPSSVQDRIQCIDKFINDNQLN